MKDNLYTKDELREGIMQGIRKCASAVGGTMGTSGSNALLEAIENPGYLATNDGEKILESIRFSDPLEEMGRKILLEAVKRANKLSGDGSSTTTVLTASLLEIGSKYLDEVSSMELKRSLEECIPILERCINHQKKDITVDEVSQVATISAEDETIGNLIQEIYQKIGKDGIIHWDISKTDKDIYTIGSGLTLDTGYFSEYMCDANPDGSNSKQVRLKNATVLIVKQKITSASEFNNLFQALFNKEIKDVVVFCDEIDPLVVPDLVKTRALRGFRTVLIKMPVLWKDEWFEDLALASKGTVIDPSMGLALKDATLEHLGKFENILVTKEETFIDGIADLSNHITKLTEEGTEGSVFRASRLNTKTARYFVGGLSDNDLSYRRLKVEDAIGASYNALRGGVVVGGGLALRNCIDLLPNTVGGRILKEVLWTPAKQIVSNMGITPLTKKTWWFKQPENSFYMGGYDFFGEVGLNSKTGEVVNMFEEGIVDPAPVVVNALRNAISVGAGILATNVLVTLPREEQSLSLPQIQR